VKIRGRSRLIQIARQVKSVFVSKAIILMYHRVADSDFDPRKLCVKPQHFAEQMEALQKYAHPIRLDELVQASTIGRIPDRAVAVTFDDGYADNFFNAKPVLERYNIPATVFVTTEYIGQDCEFWSDELERILLQPRTLPDTLNLHIAGTSYQWELRSATHYTEAEHRRDRHLKAGEERPGTRLAFYFSLWEHLAPLPAAQQKDALSAIRDWSGTKVNFRSACRPLNVEELRSLVQCGMLEIGAHTVSHAQLPAHSKEYQRGEILKSKIVLQEILSHRVTSFAYPYGEYNQDSVKLVEKAGFTSACTTNERSVQNKCNCFELPRFEVEDCNGKAFAKHLSRWFRS
jgi:peptidoglycan/xylan/chitin deacetylase (PgdA/CDA1 family)